MSWESGVDGDQSTCVDLIHDDVIYLDAFMTWKCEWGCDIGRVL